MVCRTDTLLEREHTHWVTLPDNWHSSLLRHQPLGTRHPLLPHGTLVLHQIIYDYLILYTYIYCQGARDLDIIVFWFLVFFSFFSFLHIVLNFSLKLCTTWWWPPLWPKHVVVSYLPPCSYIIIIIIELCLTTLSTLYTLSVFKGTDSPDLRGLATWKAVI